MAGDHVVVVLHSWRFDRNLLPVEDPPFWGEFAVDGVPHCHMELSKCDLMTSKTFLKLKISMNRNLCLSWGKNSWNSALATNYFIQFQLLDKKGVGKLTPPRKVPLESEIVIAGFCTEGDVVDAATGPTDVSEFSCEFSLKLLVEWARLEPCLESINTSRILRTMEQLTELADVTVVAGLTEFEAHSLILSAHSPVFKAMLNSTEAHGNRKRIEILDTDPQTLNALIKCMYGADLITTCKNVRGLVQMMDAAEKYGARNLAASGLRYLTEHPLILCSLENKLEMFLYGHRNSNTELKKRSLFTLLHYSFCGTSFGRNAVATEFAVQHPEAILEMLSLVGPILKEAENYEI